MSKKKQTREKASIEDIYRNKYFVQPKEQNLETIFEEPRHSKDGIPILTSVKKYKRYLHFDPTQNKIQKRKKKAKKCFKKLKTSYRITRSSPENSKSDDISMYILSVLGDSSNDSDASDRKTFDKTRTGFTSDQCPNVEAQTTGPSGDGPCSDLSDTPKRKCDTRPCQLQDQDIVNIADPANEGDDGDEVATNTVFSESQNSDTVSQDETISSPRRLPEKSMEILAH